MVSIQAAPSNLKYPPDLNSKEFAYNKYAYYKWMREESPIFRGKLSFLDAYIFSRYDDCASMLTDPRFVRNRTTATGGGGRMPIPMPKAAKLMMQSIITEDDPEHHRLRSLVQQAFTRHSLEKIGVRIEQLTHDLLDKAEAASSAKGSVDLKEAYSLPIPVTVIQEMVGVQEEDMPKFRQGIDAMVNGLSGLGLIKTMLWDIPQLSKLVRKLIDRKRSNPQDDMLTKLIQAEEEGEKLSEDELVSMVFVIITAGYETTVQLITNGVLALLQHPEQLQKLREQPELIDSAVEEMLRFIGPVYSTESMYVSEDVTMHGVTIPKGAAALPLIGAANHDPAAFENPEVFDITREMTNRHLGFGGGIHSCLGAPLARMETKIAIANLLKRNPNLRLAVDPSELELQVTPGFHAYKRLPVVLG